MFNTVHFVDQLLIYWYVHLFPIYANVTLVPKAELKVGRSSSWCSRQNLPFSPSQVWGIPPRSQKNRNYPSKWQYITLPEDCNNNIVNYCWSFTKLEVKDDCFFGTSFWNTSIFSLKTISCSWRRAARGFCHSTQAVQRMSPLKWQELRHLCPSPAFTIETPSTELAPAQRRGWKIAP